jgi:hypothetical protein
VLQPVPLQPLVELAVALQPLLQLLQRKATGIGLCALFLHVLHLGQRLAPLLFEPRYGLLLAVLPGHGFTDPLAQFGEILVPVGKNDAIGNRQRLALECQTLAPAGDDLQRALRVSTIRLLDMQPLFRLGDVDALPIHHLERRSVPLLGQRQALVRRLTAQLALFDALVGERQQLLPARLVARPLRRLRLPVRLVVGQLRQARLEFPSRFAPVTNLGFQPCNFGICRKELALRRMDAVAGREMRLTRLFEPRFEVAQRRVLRFELVHRLVDLARQAIALALRLVAPQQPEQLLLARQLVAVLTVLAGDAGLAFEALHLRREFEADVFDARQIVARVGEAALGFLAPLLVAGHACRLFEEDTQFVRFGLDDPRDGALADDRVSTRTEAGAEEEVGDILAPNVQVVDVVLGLSVARQQALDREFGILRPLTRQASERVVEDQFDRRPRYRLARSGTVEDHVLHRFAAQLRSLRLAEHPAYGVHHVRLAATVGTHDANELTG